MNTQNEKDQVLEDVGTETVQPIESLEVKTVVEKKDPSTPWLTVPMAIIIGCACIGIGIAVSGSFSQTKNSLSDTNKPSENSRVSIKELTSLAKSIGVPNTDIFETCLENHETKGRVLAQKKDAADKGAEGTPYNILYFSNGESLAIPGALPLEKWKEVIDQQIQKKSAIKKPQPIESLYKDTYTFGKKDGVAPEVVIVEYSDIDCPFCKKLHPVLEDVVEHYQGRVIWVYQHNPLDKHPDAQIKAEATECAGKAGGEEFFWKYLHAIIQ